MSLWRKFKETVWGSGTSDRNNADGSPSYGRGVTGIVNRGRDVFDANSRVDQYKRAQNTPIPFKVPENYREEQKQKGMINPRENLGEQLFAAPVRLVNTTKAGIGGSVGLNQIALDYVRGKDWQKRATGVQKTLDKDLSDRAGLFGWGTYFKDAKDARDITPGELAKRTVGSGAEIASFGVGGAGVTQIAKQASKEGVKITSKQGAKKLIPELLKTSAGGGMGSGGYELGTNENATPLSVGGATASGSVAAPLFGLGVAGASKGVGKLVVKGGKNTGKTSVNIHLSDDLKSAPNIKPEIQKVKANTLEMGSDTLGTNIDKKVVEKYVSDIKAGKAIDPLVITKEKGVSYLQDDKHRLAALQMLGVDDVPVVVKSAPPKTIKITPGTPQKGTTQAIGDLMPDLRARQQQAQLQGGANPQAPNQVMPNQAWTREAVYKDLLGAGLSADDVSKLTKRYDLSAQKWRAVLNATGKTDNAKSIPAVMDSQIRKVTGKKPITDTITAEPSVKTEPTVKIVNGNKVDTLTGEILDTPVKPKATPKIESKLGSMSDEFYQSKKGNQKVGYRDLENLGKQVSKQIDDDLAQTGTTYSDVARKIQTAVDNGVKTLEEAGLTPEQAQIIRKAQAEMNYMRRRASLGNKEISKGDFGEMYLPRQKEGQYGGDALFEGFRTTKPGSEFTRKGTLKAEDMDYSSEVVGQYITRYGDTKAYQQQRIINQMKRNNPDLPDEKISEAAAKVIGVQDKINNLKTKIGALGFGRRKTHFEGKTVDTAAELSDVGKSLGKQQIEVTGAPKGLTLEDKINSVKVGDKTLMDYVGLNQYRDAPAYASKQVADAQGNRQVLAQSVENRLRKEYNISDDTIDYIVGGISRVANSVDDKTLTARVAGSYTMAAKQQMMESLQNINITDAKARKVVSDLTNQILREGSIENELSAKVVRAILTTQNAIFRKLNISSAINELSDIPAMGNYYGKDLKLKPDFKVLKELGITGDLDPAIQPYIRQIEDGKSLKSVLGKINDNTNLYKFVETYKAAVIASTGKKFYTNKGLKGDELVKQVLQDYRDIALPVDAFTKTALDNMPLFAQYMSWGVRNLQKEGRLATGKLAGGKLADMTTSERAIRNAYTNLPAKTAFWIASNGLKGTAFMTAFGLTDFTGLTNQDFSGIQEEDKSLFDKATKFTNISTTMSLFNSVVQSWEKEQLKNSDKYADADYNPYENNRLDQDIMNLYKPQFAKNIWGTKTGGALDLMEDGYSANVGGRIQYEAPTDFWNTAKAYVFGKGQTDNAREYSGNLSFIDRLKKGDNPVTALTNMFKEDFGLQDSEYNRPLTDKYSDAYKELPKEGRTAMLQGGRQYNKFLDNMRKNDKEKYDQYISSLDGNHVSPEYWKSIYGDSEKGNLEIFKMIGDRKKQMAKDLGEPYDPIYDLPDNQAKSVMQMKAAATGDDISLRNNLYKEQWYKDYMDKVKAYYTEKERVDSDFKQTARVTDWYNLNDQYNSLRTVKTDDGGEPEWASVFPYVYTQKKINDEFGFDSEQSKNFFRTYGDQYRAEKGKYDEANLALINQMREIEGFPPMSEEQYAQATKIVDTDKTASSSSSSSSSSGSGGGSRSVRINASRASFGQARTLNIPSGKIKVSNVKVAQSKPKTVKIKRAGRRA